MEGLFISTSLRLKQYKKVMWLLHYRRRKWPIPVSKVSLPLRFRGRQRQPNACPHALSFLPPSSFSLPLLHVNCISRQTSLTVLVYVAVRASFLFKMEKLQDLHVMHN
ncbi:hypothetical protein LIER_31971 [Lithospermum erythrorhizon]|uniref:Uncharacterized protein n=1 Tax=Lithospermum erythrorhizon TaxID=34254 RepID=A0AAV3RSM3_LITER